VFETYDLAKCRSRVRIYHEFESAVLKKKTSRARARVCVCVYSARPFSYGDDETRMYANFANCTTSSWYVLALRTILYRTVHVDGVQPRRHVFCYRLRLESDNNLAKQNFHAEKHTRVCIRCSKYPESVKTRIHWYKLGTPKFLLKFSVKTSFYTWSHSEY